MRSKVLPIAANNKMYNKNCDNACRAETKKKEDEMKGNKLSQQTKSMNSKA
jgi:hypothetical protein